MIAILHRENGNVLRSLDVLTLQTVDLSGCALAGANLRGFDLRHANFDWADLVGADLRQANLSEASLLGASVGGVDAVGARLPNGLDGRLLEAYCRTTYRTETPAGDIDIRVGALHAALDALLQQHALLNWAFLIAENPRSNRQSDEANAAAHSRLCEAVHGRVTFPGEARADDDSWPSERGLCVLGLSRSKACYLGQNFGQVAVVVGHITCPAELRVCL